MTIELPTPLPTATGWQLSDFLRRRVTTGAAAGGIASVDLGQLPDGELWLIDRAVVSCSSSTATVLRFYESAIDPTRYLSGSGIGNWDEADYPSETGLQIPPGSSLVAVWTGCSDGARGQLYVQGRIMRRAG